MSESVKTAVPGLMQAPIQEKIQELRVELGDRSYPIFIAHGLLNASADSTVSARVSDYITGSQAIVVSNETVAPLYLATLCDSIRRHSPDVQLDTLVLPDGEQHKTLTQLNTVFDSLLECKHNRSTTLIALGGGVVGDMTGLAAACYQRGVGFIQVPTTLLAQVDSSVGGKTAVNHPLGKNMIGAFHQPLAVFADTQVLTSLPQRELLAGIAEVIKYGLIVDGEFFGWLEANAHKLRALEPAALAHVVAVSCQCKADIVARDEREQGQRALLNLGHTFGHAIETCQNYRGLLHGEAVAVGMVLAAELSLDLGMLDAGSVARLRALLADLGMVTGVPADVGADAMMAAMDVDKKVIDGRMRLILLSAVGEARVCDGIDRSQLRSFLHSHCA